MQGRAQAVQPRYVGHRVPRPVAIAARYPPLAQRRAQYKAAMSQGRAAGNLPALLFHDNMRAADHSLEEFKEGEDDGAQLLPVRYYLDQRAPCQAPGVIACYDDRRSLQLVAYTDNVAMALASLRERAGDERCAWCRVLVFRNHAMRTPQALRQEAERWVDEAGTLPPGNGSDTELWLGKPDEASDPSSSGDDDANQRSPAFVSPFTKVSVQRTMDMETSSGASAELTVESVDSALDGVRPYLMADGGNVEVVYVDNGIVGLRLQGNCSTCSSSTATVKMGIEKALVGAFGERFRGVVQLEAVDPGATKASVDTHLNMLRGAVESFGGRVEVVAVEGGVCELRYKGPKPIAMGLAAAIRDRFLDIKEVKIHTEEEEDKPAA